MRSHAQGCTLYYVVLTYLKVASRATAQRKLPYMLFLSAPNRMSKYAVQYTIPFVVSHPDIRAVSFTAW